MNIQAITSLLGSENVLTGDALASFVVNGVTPAAAAVPGAREEAAELILLAREQGWSLVPWGGGTQGELGFPPPDGFVAVSTARLNRLVDYQPDDMTVTVEPGMTVAALERVLAERGQFLPLDPPLPERATVGGTIAAAASGPWRAAYGTPRDWVIGCRVVGADGKEVRGGGQVVKNVAGYDLPKLYTGSYGTLGLITEVTFKVMPRPPASAVCRVTGEPAALERLIASILASDLQPTMLDLVQSWSRESTAASDRSALVVQFMNVQEAVDWQVKQLRASAATEGATLEQLSGDELDGVLSLLRDAPATHPFAARINTVSSEAVGLTGRALDACHGRGLSALGLARAGNGPVFLMAEGGDAAFAEELRALAKAFGASCLFPRLPAALVGTVDPWGAPGPEQRLLAGIKKALDPTGVFSGGRFVGQL